MKGALANLTTIIAGLVLLAAVATAHGMTSQAEPQSQHPAPQVQPSSGQSSGAPEMEMMGQGMMNGPAMMGRHMMGGSGGMMPGGMMQGGMMQGGMMPGCMMDMRMMMNDPKTRGQMMQIQGRMMREMGELMEQRGKELEQAK